MSKCRFELSTHDSEGGDYPRIHSLYHQGDFYLHKDMGITFRGYHTLGEREGYLVSKDPWGDGADNPNPPPPFWIHKKNCDWYCKDCGDYINCNQQYIMPTECEVCPRAEEKYGV